VAAEPPRDTVRSACASRACGGCVRSCRSECCVLPCVVADAAEFTADAEVPGEGATAAAAAAAAASPPLPLAAPSTRCLRPGGDAEADDDDDDDDDGDANALREEDESEIYDAEGKKIETRHTYGGGGGGVTAGSGAHGADDDWLAGDDGDSGGRQSALCVPLPSIFIVQCFVSNCACVAFAGLLYD